MPFTPAVTASVGFLAQQTYGAPGSPYQQPLAPPNGTDYNQPPVSQYPQNAYDAAAPPSSAYGPVPWSGGQTYGQPWCFGTPDVLGSGTHPNYSASSPSLSNTGGSANGGATTETMQPGAGRL